MYALLKSMSFHGYRIEHTIGKQLPGPSDDRAKSTVLARMQRVEGAMSDMGHTMQNILILLKTVDRKLDRLSPSRSSSSILTQMNVKFSSVDEEIP